MRYNYNILSLFLLLITLFFVQGVSAQTDPNNDLTWDWRADNSYKVYIPQGFGQPIEITSPFLQGGISEAVRDYEPADGWVLVLRDFGLPTREQAIPYFILYNKYQALLRLFVYVYTTDTFSNGGVELSFGSESRTAALTFLEPRAWASDNLAMVENNRSTAITPIAPGHWSFADFPMAYDPFMPFRAPNNPLLHFKIWGIDNFDIKLTALGDLKQVFGDQQPANIPSQTPISSGNNFNAALKQAEGTQKTWQDWSKTINSMATSVPANSGYSSVTSLRNSLLELTTFWSPSSLGLIGAGVGLVDFFISGGRSINQATPAPMNFLLNLTMEGTMRTQRLVSPGVTLPLPGSNQTVKSIPVDLLYKEPLGNFNMVYTPVLRALERYKYLGNNLSMIWNQFRLRENVAFDINPASNLELKSVEGAITYRVDPYWTGPDSNNFFLNMADTGEVKLESAVNGEYVFRTDYVPINSLTNLRIFVPPYSQTYDICIKVKAILTRKDESNAQPIVFVATYKTELYDFDSTPKPVVEGGIIPLQNKPGILGFKIITRPGFYYSIEIATDNILFQNINSRNNRNFFSSWWAGSSVDNRIQGIQPLQTPSINPVFDYIIPKEFLRNSDTKDRLYYRLIVSRDQKGTDQFYSFKDNEFQTAPFISAYRRFNIEPIIGFLLEPLPGDINDDGAVDRADINLLSKDLNKRIDASTCGLPCDLDGDGKITVLDARKLAILCTRPLCAP